MVSYLVNKIFRPKTFLDLPEQKDLFFVRPQNDLFFSSFVFIRFIQFEFLVIVALQLQLLL